MCGSFVLRHTPLSVNRYHESRSPNSHMGVSKNHIIFESISFKSLGLNFLELFVTIVKVMTLI